MKKTIFSMRYILPLLIFLMIIVFLWRGLMQKPTIISSPLIGKPVPEFSSYSLFHPNVLLANNMFKGHVSLLNVWASWCYSCRAEHSMLMRIAQIDKLTLFGLDYKDKPVEAIKWLTKQGNPYRSIISDPNGKLAMDLGVYGTPETFLIDRQGIIRYKYIGPISPQAWRNKLLPRIKKLM